jgi:hypothetical protein
MIREKICRVTETNAALAMPSKNWKLQTRLLVSEGAPHQQIRNCLKIIQERRRKIGCGSEMCAWHQDRLADRPSERWIRLWLWLDLGTQNIRDLNSAVVRRMTVQVIKIVLQPQLSLIRHNLLYLAWTQRGIVYVLYIQNYSYIMQ